MDRKLKATELHHKGFNCAQAVVMAYCDLFDMDQKTAMRAAEGFGAGMGCSCKTKYGRKRICKDGPVLVKEEIIW